MAVCQFYHAAPRCYALGRIHVWPSLRSYPAASLCGASLCRFPRRHTTSASVQRAWSSSNKTLKSHASDAQQAATVPGCWNEHAPHPRLCSMLLAVQRRFAPGVSLPFLLRGLKLLLPARLHRESWSAEETRGAPARSQLQHEGTHHVDGQPAEPSEACMQSANQCFHMYTLNTMLSPPSTWAARQF